jgi:hypothetical protein
MRPQINNVIKRYSIDDFWFLEVTVDVTERGMQFSYSGVERFIHYITRARRRPRR